MILGGGQLGLMLHEAAEKLSQKLQIEIKCIFLCAEGEICTKFDHEIGDVTEFQDVYNFGLKYVGIKNVILTTEVENVSSLAVRALQNNYISCFPRAKTIFTIQDKLRQYQTFQEAKVSVPNTIQVPDLDTYQRMAEAGEINFPVMFKSTNGGYDGKGVKYLSNDEELPTNINGQFILQEFVRIEQEISVIIGRSTTGDVFVYPVFDMEFNENHQVKTVTFPSRIDQELQIKAQEIAKICAEKLNVHGLLAVELFITRDGNILVNEAACRPHNSGHLTIDGFDINQFEMHLRCILELTDDIQDPNPTQLFSMMYNLIGHKNCKENYNFSNFDLVNTYCKNQGYNMTTKDYGKNGRPGRKLGHINATSPEELTRHQKSLLARKLALIQVS